MNSRQIVSYPLSSALRFLIPFLEKKKKEKKETVCGQSSAGRRATTAPNRRREAKTVAYGLPERAPAGGPLRAGESSPRPQFHLCRRERGRHLPAGLYSVWAVPLAVAWPVPFLWTCVLRSTPLVSLQLNWAAEKPAAPGPQCHDAGSWALARALSCPPSSPDHRCPNPQGLSM